MKNKIEKIFAIPHFHFDLEWWKTEDASSEDVDGIIEKALDMLENNPAFKYTLDQALAVRPYWDAHPKKRALIRRLVSEGRIELVGGTLCAPDENIPTGEALVRQFIHGLRFFENEMGGKVETAWEIDEFGHPEQMPQIIAKCGMKQFVFARGVVRENWKDQPLDFFWEAPDGSRILTHWLSAHYTGFIPIFKPAINRLAFKRELRSRIGYEAPKAYAGILMAPFGTDFQAPSEEWIDFIERWNSSEKEPVEFALPREYFAALRERTSNIPDARGEFNPCFTGCYESREKVKALCRASQHAALEAEKFAAITFAAGWLPWPRRQLDNAWENILKNDFHDILCGTGADPVYRNTLKRYASAIKEINSVRAKAVNVIARHADTSAAGKPIVVFNSLNHARRDIASVPLSSIGGASLAKQRGLYLAGPGGERAPAQISGGELIFTADVPPLGYSVYHLRRDTAKNNSHKTGHPADPFKINNLAFENDRVRIGLDPHTGALYSLIMKDAGYEALDTTFCFSNELLVEEDVGNLWTVHKTGREWKAARYPVSIRLIESGPVRLTVEVSGPHKDAARRQLIMLHAGSPRVDFITEINFGGRDARIRALFGTKGNRAVFETPFCATVRGNGHHCAQNWVDMHAGGFGLALFNRGNPGHEIDGGVVSLTLMRSISVLPEGLPRFVLMNLPGIAGAMAESLHCYLSGLGAGLGEYATHKYHGINLREWASEGGPPWKGGGFPTSPDHIVPFLKFFKQSLAWENGPHRFHYAALPHTGDFRDAALPKNALAFNTPLLAVPAPRSRGTLPSQHSFFSTGASDAAIMTTLKKSETDDSLVARIYDAHGTGAPIRIQAWKPLKSCGKTNLVEKEDLGKIATRSGRATDKLAPFEIATYKINL